jgi:steroid delta-isomerase-like uncharacterized protein
MSLEENSNLVRRYVDGVNKANFDALDELVIPDFVDHDAFPGQEPGHEGLKKAYAMFLNAFPDVYFDLQDVIAEGDKVVGRGVITGTHRGDFLGVPPTGRSVTWTGTRLFTVKDGKLTEGWLNIDLLSLMQQLGAIPAPGPTTT